MKCNKVFAIFFLMISATTFAQDLESQISDTHYRTLPDTIQTETSQDKEDHQEISTNIILQQIQQGHERLIDYEKKFDIGSIIFLSLLNAGFSLTIENPTIPMLASTMFISRRVYEHNRTKIWSFDRRHVIQKIRYFASTSLLAIAAAPFYLFDAKPLITGSDLSFNAITRTGLTLYCLFSGTVLAVEMIK